MQKSSLTVFLLSFSFPPPALNDNLASGQIAFSVVDGEPYVKVGADTPRPFKNDNAEIAFHWEYTTGSKNPFLTIGNNRWRTFVFSSETNFATIFYSLKAGSETIFRDLAITSANVNKELPYDISKYRGELLTLTVHYLGSGNGTCDFKLIP